MKYLLIRERLHRINFKKVETQYLALKFVVHNQSIADYLRWEASLLLSKLLKTNSRVFFKKSLFLNGTSTWVFEIF